MIADELVSTAEPTNYRYVVGNLAFACSPWYRSLMGRLRGIVSYGSSASDPYSSPRLARSRFGSYGSRNFRSLPKDTQRLIEDPEACQAIRCITVHYTDDSKALKPGTLLPLAKLLSAACNLRTLHLQVRKADDLEWGSGFFDALLGCKALEYVHLTAGPKLRDVVGPLVSDLQSLRDLTVSLPTWETLKVSVFPPALRCLSLKQFRLDKSAWQALARTSGSTLSQLAFALPSAENPDALAALLAAMGGLGRHLDNLSFCTQSSSLLHNLGPPSLVATVDQLLACCPSLARLSFQGPYSIGGLSSIVAMPLRSVKISLAPQSSPRVPDPEAGRCLAAGLRGPSLKGLRLLRFGRSFPDAALIYEAAADIGLTNVEFA